MSRRLGTDAFVREIQAMAAALSPGERRLVALAGPPGSGKSYVAERLLDGGPAGAVAVLPMDGYHYDDELLTRLGRRAHKGAPDTFDVGGLAAMLKRLAANAEEAIAVPRFDRSLEIARAGAILIPQSVKVVVAEGNYLLLDEPPWDALAGLFHLTAMIETDEAVLRERLTRRWLDHGIAAPEIAARVEDNDLPNGRRVLAASRAADIVLRDPA